MSQRVLAENRIWTHVNGVSIAGSLKDYKDGVAVIAHGETELKININQLSIKDREHILRLYPLPEDEGSEPNTSSGTGSVAGSGTKADTEAGKKNNDSQDLIMILNQFAREYEQSENELQKSACRTRRQLMLKEQFQNRNVEDWVGRLSGMVTDSNRDAVITIEIIGSPDEDLGKSGIPVSLKNLGYPIKHGSELYDRMANMRIGDIVIFSGEFIKCDDDHLKEESITERGGMLRPEFDFYFGDVSKDPN